MNDIHTGCFFFTLQRIATAEEFFSQPILTFDPFNPLQEAALECQFNLIFRILG